MRNYDARMKSRVIFSAALLAISVTGCGGGDSSSSDSTPQASGPAETWPSCDQAWQTGQTLPKDYEGCVIKGDSVAVFSPEQCPSGATYASYDDRWYAVPGDTIRESKGGGNIFSDKDFQKFTQSC